MTAAEQVKAKVSMQDVLSRYGIEVGRNGFISCPFHSEKTASCKIYENSFYCFGCSTGGDVLDFVKKIENCTFSEAIEKLGNGKISFSAKRKFLESKKKSDDREEQARKYWGLIDQWIFWDKQVIEKKPIFPDQKPEKEFFQAIANREKAAEQLDRLKEW